MVAGTFLAAPLMFVSARMLSVVVVSEMDYKDLLLKTSFDASIISMVACVSDGTIFSNHCDNSKKERFSLTFNQLNILFDLVLGLGVDHNDRQQAVQEDSPPVSSLSDSVSCK